VLLPKRDDPCISTIFANGSMSANPLPAWTVLNHGVGLDPLSTASSAVGRGVAADGPSEFSAAELQLVL